MKVKQLMLGLCSFVRDTSDFFLSQIIVFERWKNTSSIFYPMSWLQTQSFMCIIHIFSTTFQSLSPNVSRKYFFPF